MPEESFEAPVKGEDGVCLLRIVDIQHLYYY